MSARLFRCRPTPAGWPKEGTLSSAGGPCLSPASWTALLRLASVRSLKVRRGVHGFGPFCLPNKGCALRDAPCKTLPAGAKPGHTEHYGGTGVGDTNTKPSPHNAFLLANPKMDSQYRPSGCKVRTINFVSSNISFITARSTIIANM